METDELHIIARILGGKTEEFSYFLDTYGQQVFALVARMVDSQEDAEELTQDAFMKAFQHLSAFHGGSSFSTWLYRIAYNTALTALRKKPSEVLAFDDRLWETVSDQEVDEGLDDGTEERIGELEHALTLLTADERALVALFYEEGKTVQEIAAILKQTENNVKVKLHRTRKKLYVLMTKQP